MNKRVWLDKKPTVDGKKESRVKVLKGSLFFSVITKNWEWACWRTSGRLSGLFCIHSAVACQGRPISRGEEEAGINTSRFSFRSTTNTSEAHPQLTCTAALPADAAVTAGLCCGPRIGRHQRNVQHTSLFKQGLSQARRGWVVNTVNSKTVHDGCFSQTRDAEVKLGYKTDHTAEQCNWLPGKTLINKVQGLQQEQPHKLGSLNHMKNQRPYTADCEKLQLSYIVALGLATKI